MLATWCHVKKPNITVCVQPGSLPSMLRHSQMNPEHNKEFLPGEEQINSIYSQYLLFEIVRQGIWKNMQLPLL